MNALTAKEANKIYSMLVSEFNASERGREDFIHSQTSRHVIEYRFQGSLGFGGKFWRNNGSQYVTCYPEDENAARRDSMSKVNRMLQELAANKIVDKDRHE